MLKGICLLAVLLSVSALSLPKVSMIKVHREQGETQSDQSKTLCPSCITLTSDMDFGPISTFQVNMAGLDGAGVFPDVLFASQELTLAQGPCAPAFSFAESIPATLGGIVFDLFCYDGSQSLCYVQGGDLTEAKYFPCNFDCGPTLFDGMWQPEWCPGPLPGTISSPYDGVANDYESYAEYKSRQDGSKCRVYWGSKCSKNCDAGGECYHPVDQHTWAAAYSATHRAAAYSATHNVTQDDDTGSQQRRFTQKNDKA